MKKFRSFAFLLALFVLPVAAHAQGSGSSGGSSRPPRDTSAPSPERPFAVTRSVTGKIVEVNQEQGIFWVEDKRGNRHELKLTAKTKVKSDKSKEAMMKKDEAMAKEGSMEEKEKMMKKDEAMAKEGGSMEEKEMMMMKSMIESLQVGQNVKVKYLASNNTATEIELRN